MDSAISCELTIRCLFMADSVEKVCLRTWRNFLRGVGAVVDKGAGGPHGARPSKSKTPVVDLRRQTDEIEDRLVVQANFLQRSTSELFQQNWPFATFPGDAVRDMSFARGPEVSYVFVAVHESLAGHSGHRSAFVLQ